ANVEGLWMITPKGFAISRVVGYTKHKRVPAPNTLRFTEYPKEIRVEDKPRVKMLRVEAIYSNTSRLNHYEEHQHWKSVSRIPRVKHVATSIGTRYQMKLIEIYVQVHDQIG